jgi:hypothetical protein
MTDIARRRYTVLAVAYLAVAVVVALVVLAFFGVGAFGVSLAAAALSFALAMHFLHVKFNEVASKPWEREVATARQTRVIALLGVIFPLLTAVNAWLVAVLFPGDTEAVMGALVGVVFASLAALLAARYATCGRASVSMAAA